MSGETQTSILINDILKSEATEENVKEWRAKFNTTMSKLPNDQQKATAKQFLTLVVDSKVLCGLLEDLVTANVLSARVVCESILNSDKLSYERQEFWVDCFTLILRIINSVDYKGVLDILRSCIEKEQTVPALNFSVQPQLEAVEHVLEKIFNRNFSLLPYYSALMEIQSIHHNSKNWRHRRLAQLMSSFVESFRPVAQMASTTGYARMLPVVEHIGYADQLVKSWRLDSATLKLSLKGHLPYDAELLKPRTELLRYILQQPHSTDMAVSMLGLQQQRVERSIGLEEQLSELVTLAMEKAENDSNTRNEGADGTIPNHRLWLHVSSQLLYFGLLEFISFPSTIEIIHNKLSTRNLKKGRDHLMWVLLQFTSAAIERNLRVNLRPVLKLYDLLYSEDESLPIPDCSQAVCTHRMAATCIWIQLLTKAQWEFDDTFESIPIAIKAQYEFLENLSMPGASSHTDSDYRMVLLCNAYSVNADRYRKLMEKGVMEVVLGAQVNQREQAREPTAPLSVSVLDCLTGPSRTRIINNIVAYIIKLAQSNSGALLTPTLVESYSRLLLYGEVESLGLTSLVSRLMPTVFQANAWGILHTLLEVLSYKTYHVQPLHKVQILCHLHSLGFALKANHTQLHICIENTTLRVITQLRLAAFKLELVERYSDADRLVSALSEELNKVLVLTLARSMHVTGMIANSPTVIWYKELLDAVMYSTAHSWTDRTLQSFPPMLREFFQKNNVPVEDNPQIKQVVDEEYKFWTSSSKDEDAIAHFSGPGAPPIFLCIIFKMLWQTDQVKPIAWKILEVIGAREFPVHLRKLCDYLVSEFSSSAGELQINRCIEAVDKMIWKYNILTIDRLILYMALSRQESSQEQVAFFIIRLLLVKDSTFCSRVQDFVRENSAENWKESYSSEKNAAFHSKYPEIFTPAGITGQTGGDSSQHQNISVYFDNVCLRFLPVFDVLIHRYIEIPLGTKSLEVLLDQLGDLYKFHDTPVTYLYETLHYYDQQLTDRPALKRRLAATVLKGLREAAAASSVISEPFLRYISVESDDPWVSELDYCMGLIGKIVETMTDASDFQSVDWRFNEFSSPAARSLYVACVELMALPVAPDDVTGALLDVIAKGYSVIPPKDIHLWINCVGLVMAALPESYWTALYNRVVETVGGLSEWQYDKLTPFQIFNFETTYNCLLESKYSYMLAVTHSIWHHAKPAQICAMPQFVKEKLQPIVTGEEQFLFVCHLVGPALTRLNDEQPRCVAELAVSLVEMLEQVDRTQSTLKYMDPICDLLYHIKYTFVGEKMKNDVRCIVKRLRVALQTRLRFIANINLTKIQQIK